MRQKNNHLLIIISIFTLFFTPCLYANGILERPVSEDNAWYVSGDGALIAGDDSNSGTAEKPLASIQQALTLIKAAYAVEKFNTALIRIDGDISANEGESHFLGMIVIQGRDAFPSIVIRGSSDPRKLDTIDARGGGRLLYISDGNDVTIENLTLTGGRANAGAGVYVSGSRFVLGKSSLIQNNEADSGGGICTDDGVLVIHGNVIGNKAEYGGGIALRGKSIIDVYGTIGGNAAVSSGGGIFFDGAQGRIDGGLILGNTAQRGFGGGIYLESKEASLVIDSGNICGNRAQSGGGIFASVESSVIINSCVIRNNDALAGGAIALFHKVSVLLLDAKISGNTAVNGGAIMIVDGDLTAGGDTVISYNDASNSGGGINMINGSIFLSGDVQMLKNNASQNGGAVIIVNTDYEGKRSIQFVLSDNAQIEGNTAKHGSGLFKVNADYHPQGGSLADDIYEKQN